MKPTMLSANVMRKRLEADIAALVTRYENKNRMRVVNVRVFRDHDRTTNPVECIGVAVTVETRGVARD